MSSPPSDRDNIRKLIEMLEGPATRLLRDFEGSQFTKLPQFPEQSDILRLTASLNQSQQAFEACTRSEQLTEFSRVLAQAHANLHKPETIAAIRQFDQNLKALAPAINGTILPVAEHLQSFLEAAARAVSPLNEQFAKLEDWQSSLTHRMTTLVTPWALESHLGVSVVGFARIARLHDVSVGASPFEPATNEILNEELGRPVPYDTEAGPADRESAMIDAGLNPEIIAFPAHAYPAVLFSVGFELRIDRITPVDSDGGDNSGSFHPQHADLFGQVENRLRRLVETELRKLAGDGWQRRIHGDIRKKWQDRKTKDHDQRGDSYSLLFYADFMDLAEVICQGDNWKDAFGRFFISKQDFQTSMQRLIPVRNAIGHNRPLVRADQITLLSESFRFLNALGVPL